MALIVTKISIFPRDCPRRKMLEALKEGEKSLAELTEISKFNKRAYVWEIMEGMQKLNFARKFGAKGSIVIYKITDRGLNFLEKESIEDILKR